MNATPTLLVVDIQNDYFPGGRHPLHEPEAAARNARRLLDAFREREWPVVHVQHIALAPAATFFLPETPGAAIHELVRPAPGEPIVVSTGRTRSWAPGCSRPSAERARGRWSSSG